jgi:allantoinase
VIETLTRIPLIKDELIPLLNSGVKGFKCFLCDSGVEEFPGVAPKDVEKAMSKLNVSSPPLSNQLTNEMLENFFQSVNGLLLFHAEMESSRDTTLPSEPLESQTPSSPHQFEAFLSTRPSSLELTAIDFIIKSQSAFPSLKTHIVHLSSAEAIPMIESAKKRGLDLTVETCFHYLVLNSESVPNRHTEFKCCPPIRSSSNQSQLWEALISGTIDYVVSDHSPSSADVKEVESGDFLKAWGGISGLGLGLSLIWNEGLKRGVKPGKIIDWVCGGPARRVGIDKDKGGVKLGGDADLVVFDTEEEWEVSNSI